MYVGVAHEMSNPPSSLRPWNTLWQDHLWFYCELEQLGIDFIGVEEHFFAPDGHGPAPIAVAGAIVARTSTIRVGSWATILPLHHPVVLAQDWSTLDQLSGGRTFITVVPGYRQVEYRAFGLDPRTRASRMEEAYQLLQKSLQGETVTHDGSYWSVEGLELSPPPLQKPYPVWGGATSVPAARRAARNGAHLAAMSGDPAVFAAYREELEAQGEDPERYRISVGMSLNVTMEDPDAVWARHREFFRRRYAEPESHSSEYGDPGFEFGAGASVDEESRWRSNEIIGTPDQVLESVDRLRKIAPITDIVNIAPAPGIPLRTEGYELYRLFAREVLPVLRGW